MLIPITISALVMDEALGVPAAVISELGGARSFKLPLTPWDANALALAKTNPAAEKSHSIPAHLLKSFGAEISRCIITGFANNSFSAILDITGTDGRHRIPCSAAEACVLSVQHQQPLFAEDAVFAQCNDTPDSHESIAQRIASTDTMSFGSCTLS